MPPDSAGAHSAGRSARLPAEAGDPAGGTRASPGAATRWPALHPGPRPASAATGGLFRVSPDLHPVRRYQQSFILF